MAHSTVTSRRGFLRAGAGLALGLSLAHLPSTAAAQRRAGTNAISPDGRAQARATLTCTPRCVL